MRRMLRVNELIKHELGDYFERMISPELDSLVTITNVNTSPDLHNAIVSVSIYGPIEKQKKTLGFINRHRIQMQRQLAQNIRIKYTPVLQFVLDDGFAVADRVYKILDELEATENSGLDDEGIESNL